MVTDDPQETPWHAISSPAPSPSWDAADARPAPPEATSTVSSDLASLSQVTQAIATLSATVEEWQERQEQDREAWALLQDTLERMEKQFTRTAKEQFKLNAVVEASQAQLQSLLTRSEKADQLRDREVERLARALKQERLERTTSIFKGLLPVMDGLEEAIGAGERILKDLPQDATPSASLGQRIRGAWSVLRGLPVEHLPAFHPHQPLPSALLDAWVQGLVLLRTRMVHQMEAAQVRPMDSVGTPFNAQFHHVLESVPASQESPSGSVVREVRRGYWIQDEVLRYAEVVVAR